LLLLRALQNSDARALRQVVAEFGISNPEHDFVFEFNPAADFSEYVRRINGRATGRDLPPGFVPETFLVAVVGDRIVGRVSIRHKLNEFLARIGGHIGYMVVASERRRGYATEILRQALPIAASVGVTRALLTCDDDNFGSRRTIERNGGVLEGIVYPGPGYPELKLPKRRYWIDCAAG
jgi:predicted acetyltransferase